MALSSVIVNTDIKICELKYKLTVLFMRYHKIPDEAVKRLPLYLRALLFPPQDLPENIPSRKLADLLGLNPWQIRKDLSFFGEGAESFPF